MATRRKKKSATAKKSKRRVSPVAIGGRRNARAINAVDLSFPEQLKLAARELDAGQSKGIADFLARFEADYPFDTEALCQDYDRVLAEAYAHDGKLTDAERIARRALERQPDDLDLYYTLCFVKLGLREFDDAVAFGREYLSRDTRTGFSSRRDRDETMYERQTAQLHNFIGSAFFETHHWEEAVAAFEQSIAIDKGNCLPYLNLEKIYRRQGKMADARQIVQQGLTNCRRIDELRLLDKELRSMVSVSACMMVKNEEEMLPACLESIRDFVDEIIVVDTGSTDRTIEIAESYGAKVYHQPWEGNFSKHRNYSIELANSEWVLIIDADERLYEGDGASLRPYLLNPDCDIISLSVINHYRLHGGMTTHLPSVRLFRKSYGLRYEGTVHNQIPLTRDDKVYHTAARIKHLGYDLTPEKMRAKFARTRKLLEEQLAEDPSNAFAHFNYAQLLQVNEVGKYQRENIPTILESAGRAVKLTSARDKKQRPIHLMCLNQMGWAYFHDGQFEKSLEACDRAIENKPDYLDALLLRGMVLTSMGRFDDAVAAYESYLTRQSQFDPAADRDQLMLSHSDNRPAALYGLAEIAMKRKDLETARSYFEQILALRKSFLNTRTRLAEIYAADGDLLAARRNYVLQLRYGSVMIGDLVGLAGVCRKNRSHHKAIYYYKKALQAGTLEAELRFELAKYFVEQGLVEDAHRLLTEIQPHFGDDQHYWRELAEAAYRTGRLQDAIESYEHVLDTAGESGPVLSNLGNCWFNLKQFDRAEAHYRRAIDADDTPVEAYRNLGLTLAQTNRSEESIAMLEQFLSKNPGQPADILHVIGDLHGRNGRLQDAMSYYEQSLKADPLNVAAMHNISECYLRLGHVDSAVMGFRQALKIDPDHRPAKERLAQLEQAVSGR